MHAFFLLPFLSLAPADPPAAARAEGELVVLYSAGLDAVLVDPKDAGLLSVARLLGARLAELPEEFDSSVPVPPDARALFDRLIAGPVALRLGTSPEGADFPFFGQLELSGSEQASKALADSFGRVLSAFGVPVGVADERGLVPLEAPVPSRYGAFRDALVLSVGALIESPLDMSGAPLPAGVAPGLHARVDLRGLLQLAEGFGATSDPEMEQVLDMLDLLGLSEADMHWSMGADGERAYSLLRMPGMARELRASGLLPERPISRRALSAVPADASWASVGANNLKSTLTLVMNLVGDEIEQLGLGPDPLATIAERTGVHLERDVLDHLGSSFGIYASDTTGGGGWLSIVAFAELGDSERIAASIGRLEELLNGLAAAEARGYVQVRRREHQGAQLSTLTFPGVPVPLELSWTVSDGFWLLGVTPQACEAALAHVRSGSPGLLANERFTAQLAGSPDELYQVGYFDVPRYLDDGYGLASLACSALVNGTRSRVDVGRDAGRILPPYAELAAGAKVYVSSTRIVGDDLVDEARMDRSWLVNGTATAGFVASSPLLLLIPMAAGAGAFTNVREAEMAQYEAAVRLAEEAQAHQEELERAEPMLRPREQAAADILALHYAAAEFAVLNGGLFPETLDVLVVPDENGVTYLGRTELPVDPWGSPYYYVPPSAEQELPRILSLGADGVEGGEGRNADLDNHTVLERARQEGGGK